MLKFVFPNTDPTFKQWAAGVIEATASLRADPDAQGNKQVALILTTHCRGVAEKLKHVYGGSVTKPKAGVKYRWTVSGSNVGRLIQDIWVGVRFRAIEFKAAYLAAQCYGKPGSKVTQKMMSERNETIESMLAAVAAMREDQAQKI